MLVLVWAVGSYLALRSGADAANKRLEKRYPTAKAALVPQSGLVLTHPSVTLLLGTDHSSKIRERNGFERSDSIMLLRTDPGKGRLNYLSIPRDLRVNVPGHGYDKINSAFQLGGPALTIKTVRGFTDVEVNHVVVVDFDAFTKVIDKVGGVEINVPGPILSNKFDCPYATQARCDRWQGWRFAKGVQHMDGRRARVYSRIRENKLNPGESDVTRTERQQAVIQALLSKLTSAGVLAKLPFIGDDVMKPLTTDFSAGTDDAARGRQEAQQQRAALPARRDARGIRRRVSAAGRGGAADDRGVPRELGSAAAAARIGLRLRLPLVRGALGDLLDVLLVALVALLAARVALLTVARRFARAAAVVRGVEARTFEMDRNRVQDPLNRPFAAGFADLLLGVGHLLENLEDVALRAFVLIDGQQTELSFDLRTHSAW